ncbi:hypothetical protein D3C77_514010 [compost metagenome]
MSPALSRKIQRLQNKALVSVQRTYGSNSYSRYLAFIHPALLQHSVDLPAYIANQLLRSHRFIHRPTAVGENLHIQIEQAQRGVEPRYFQSENNFMRRVDPVQNRFSPACGLSKSGLRQPALIR